MTMRHTGIVHMRKSKPTGIVSASGTFVATLPVLDAWGTHAREPWRLIWAGDEARAWWDREGHTLQPGDTLQVELEKVRVHAEGKGWDAKTEIHAHVLAAQLVKRAKNEAAAAA
ncbi:hypothetical protein [Pseudorhodoferax sp. Leaf274]|uniref:hypothetical protein n=1 Tax=Pseudorhodoferax sp. Leaf274 TaxID=1736318 RepID=UPI00070265B6|nr:hypothetical protein [Pseudorhodoferax sp. Leaf274]KQP39237.1 hypothetical protein ASF44_30710 [Pseudorhodoferax sp. Leaf274]